MQDVEPIYKWIIDNTIAKARASFLQDGVDESILENLKNRWEQKLHESDVYDKSGGDLDEADGVLPASVDRDDPAPAEDIAGQEGDVRPPTKRPASGPADGSVERNVAPRTSAPDALEAGPSSTNDVPQGGQAAGDDDSDVELANADETPIYNFVLAQYEKVSRVRNKWKVSMKHGIVHIDGKEYTFAKSNAEFIF